MREGATQFIPKENLEEQEPKEQQPEETGEVKIEEEIEKITKQKKYKEGSFLRRNLKKITAVLAPLGIGIGVTVAGWKYSESKNIAETFQKYQEQSARIVAQREEAQEEAKEKEEKLEQATKEMEIKRIQPRYEYKEDNIRSLLHKARNIIDVLIDETPENISNFVAEAEKREVSDQELCKIAENIDQDVTLQMAEFWANEVNFSPIYRNWELCENQDAEVIINNTLMELPSSLSAGIGEINFSESPLSPKNGGLAESSRFKGALAERVTVYKDAVSSENLPDLRKFISHEAFHCGDFSNPLTRLGIAIETADSAINRLGSNDRYYHPSFAYYDAYSNWSTAKTSKPQEAEDIMREYLAYMFNDNLYNPNSPNIPSADKKLYKQYMNYIAK